MSTPQNHVGKNELVPQIEKMQDRGVDSKVKLPLVGNMIVRGAENAHEAGRGLDPREAAAFDLLAKVFKDQKLSSDPVNEIRLDPMEPTRGPSKHAKTSHAQAAKKASTLKLS